MLEPTLPRFCSCGSAGDQRLFNDTELLHDTGFRPSWALKCRYRCPHLGIRPRVVLVEKSEIGKVAIAVTPSS